MRSVNSERGATIPFVALCMVVIMGMAALSIDLGNGWRTRRALIQTTDAAALAAAQDYANGLPGCAGVDSTYVNLNDPNPGFTTHTCSWVPLDAHTGRVTVEATTNVDTWFAGVIGRGDYQVSSTTTAVVGPPADLTGLRPIGLCLEGSTALQNIVNSPPAPGSTVPLTIDYDKDQPSACGGAATPGNWGVIDFGNDGNSNAVTKYEILNGSDETVIWDNDGATSCAGPEAHCYEGDTGALAGINNELTQLKNSGIFFTIPVFDHVELVKADCGGSGGNTCMHLMGVLRVRLVDFKVNGNPNGRFFTFDVQPGLVPGTTGGSGSGSGNNKVIAICGVDPGEFAACNP